MNWGIRVLQTLALPLGYVAVVGANCVPLRPPCGGHPLHFVAPPLPNETRYAGLSFGENDGVGARNREQSYDCERRGRTTERTNPAACGRTRLSAVREDDGAGDEARTRYLHLGKVALYQMSYARIIICCHCVLCAVYRSLYLAQRKNAFLLLTFLFFRKEK